MNPVLIRRQSEICSPLGLKLIYIHYTLNYDFVQSDRNSTIICIHNIFSSFTPIKPISAIFNGEKRVIFGVDKKDLISIPVHVSFDKIIYYVHKNQNISSVLSRSALKRYRGRPVWRTYIHIGIMYSRLRLLWWTDARNRSSCYRDLPRLTTPPPNRGESARSARVV